jgi:large subunit ribosomal protein L25
LPADLPSTIEVDIASLNNFDDVIAIKDLKVSDKVEVLGEPEEVVAKVQAPRDVEAELAEPVGEVDVTQVEGVADAPTPEAGETKE